MKPYSHQEMQDTMKIVASSIAGCEKVRPKLKEGSASFSLNTNRIKALYIAKALLLQKAHSYTKEDLEKAVVQITSIRSKSTTGIHHAREGSATYTRFYRLIAAMDIILDYLQDALDALS